MYENNQPGGPGAAGGLAVLLLLLALALTGCVTVDGEDCRTNGLGPIATSAPPRPAP